MATLAKFEKKNLLEITIEHSSVNRNEYEEVIEEAGNGATFIGIKALGHKIGFSVNNKKFDITKVKFNKGGKKNSLLIEVPRMNAKQLPEDDDVISGSDSTETTE